jgi:hypothetical protein
MAAGSEATDLFVSGRLNLLSLFSLRAGLKKKLSDFSQL